MWLNILANYLEVVPRLLPLLRVVQRLRPAQGSYEVIRYTVELEILDDCGQEAIYRKSQRIRFLQDDVVSYLDTLWGDGQIFEDYRTSYGYPVDMYQEGHRHRVLISFREAKHKGDEQDIHIERRIGNGFAQSFEALQTEMYHRVREVTVKIIFPKRRQPKKVRILQKNRGQAQTLSQEHFHELADGRLQIEWQMKYPRIHEMYTLRWQW